MEIWNNKKTGKGFVYIEDTGFDEALFVTPLGEIKSLKKSLFEEELTEEKVVVTELQEKRYQEYKDRRTWDLIDRVCLQLYGHPFSETTANQQEELLKALEKGMERSRKHSEEHGPNS